MKTTILFSGSAPLLLLTSYDLPGDLRFTAKLATKGIKKFVAYDVPLALVKEKYGKHYDVVMADLNQTDDLRVLDYDGFSRSEFLFI